MVSVGTLLDICSRPHPPPTINLDQLDLCLLLQLAIYNTKTPANMSSRVRRRRIDRELTRRVDEEARLAAAAAARRAAPTTVRRRRASSTSRSTSTRASTSSLPVDARVRRFNTLCRGVADNAAVTGILKGYDQLMNLVMDEVVESYESRSTCKEGGTNPADDAIPKRTLGLVVLRGPNVVLISPTDGSAGELTPPVVMAS